MKIALFALPAIAVAHDVVNGARHAHVARQGPPLDAAAVSSSTPAAPSLPAAATSGSALSGGAIVPTPVATGSTTSYSYSLLSTNPTAIPLASIVSGTLLNRPTIALHTTVAAGAQPSGISGAPALPNISALNPALYPPPDKTPPTDSPEVKQWIKEVAASGVTIPNLSQTVAGGCAANAAAAADLSRCWWSCTGCVRATDVDSCPQPLTWGLTFDDGPAFYTPNLLTYLAEKDIKSTFFVVGSRVIAFPAMVQAEYIAGHQLAVHTWGHQSLTMLTNDEIIAQLGWTIKAIKDVVGVTPLHFRPPFGDIDDRVRAIALAMKLTPIMWTRISATATFDTDDFGINGGSSTADKVLYNWKNILANVTTRSNGFIVLEHDLFPQAVDIATGYIIPDALAHKPAFTIEPIIKCLGKAPGDAYLETNNNKTNPVPSGSLGATGAAGTGVVPGAAQATGSGAAGNSSARSFGISTIGLITAAAGLMAGAAVVLL